MSGITLCSLVRLLDEKGVLENTYHVAQDSNIMLCGTDCDSRVVEPGHLFVCKGRAFHKEYLLDALSKGAPAYLCDTKLAPTLISAAPDVPMLIARDLRRAMAYAAQESYGHPDQNLTIIGITGTKGKSSVSYMLRSVLDGNEPGSAAAVIGSIDTYDGIEHFESHNTTPESPDLWRHLAHADRSKLPYVDMEVSSQGLKYDRVLGLQFDIGVFLNIGEDHISAVEHPDFEDYFQSKLTIFSQCAHAVVNLDSDELPRILAAAEACGHTSTFSASDKKGADIYATSIRSAEGHIHFTVHTPRRTYPVELGMPGLFNVENALSVCAICEVLGLETSRITSGLFNARVPGRMELLRTADPNLLALVDYAHNVLSFRRFFASVKAEFPGAFIVAVFGAPGGKAYERRHALPLEAAKYADYLIYTEEDPANDCVADICAEMLKATPPNVSAEAVPDREQAIYRAVEVAQSHGGPAVLCLLAKGDETRQHRGDAFVPVRTDGEIFYEAAGETISEAMGQKNEPL